MPQTHQGSPAGMAKFVAPQIPLISASNSSPSNSLLSPIFFHSGCGLKAEDFAFFSQINSSAEETSPKASKLNSGQLLKAKGSCSTSVHPHVHGIAWEFGWHLSLTAGCQPWGPLSLPASRDASISFPRSFCMGQRQVLDFARQSCMTSHINTPSRHWLREQMIAEGRISELVSNKITRSGARKKEKKKKTCKKIYWNP